MVVNNFDAAKLRFWCISVRADAGSIKVYADARDFWYGRWCETKRREYLERAAQSESRRLGAVESARHTVFNKALVKGAL